MRTMFLRNFPENPADKEGHCLARGEAKPIRLTWDADHIAGRHFEEARLLRIA